jgi:outer membrane beta-barrel protein
MDATMKMLHKICLLTLLALSGPAFAQDDIDDLFEDDETEKSTKEEKEAIEADSSDTAEATSLIEQNEMNKQIIKTLQRKTFLKLKRWEISPHAAFVINDPFLKRRIIGTGVAYNLTEIFAIEATIDYGMDLGDADLTTLTKQVKDDNNVAPDISRLMAFGDVTFVYSPIYGKAAILGRKIVNFDVYGKFGMGIGQTKDDGTISGILDGEDNQCPDIASLNSGSEAALFCQTQIQWHPTTTFGGGVRVIFNDNMAARLEGRSLTYIETVNSTMLEMKNNFIVQGSVSFFVPNIKQ